MITDADRGALRSNIDRCVRERAETEPHTRLLRVSLAVEESREYWRHACDVESTADRSALAFEHRWFGHKSMERVKALTLTLAERFDTFPEALAVLSRWRDIDLQTRRLICHWHTALTDPIYRTFTGQFLVERRTVFSSVDRDAVARWLGALLPDRWAPATLVQFASKLLTAAAEAGLVSSRSDPRRILEPRVSDHALAYLLHVLRGVAFSGTLFGNAYFASVGLDAAAVEARVRGLEGIHVRRMGSLLELEFDAPNITAWSVAANVCSTNEALA